VKIVDLIWKEKFETFFTEVPEHQRSNSSSRLSWTSRNTKVVSLYYGIGCESLSLTGISSQLCVTPGRIRQFINHSKKMLEAYYSGKQTIERAKKDKLKVRFLKYFQLVPKDDWFTGRRDAPLPTLQVQAVQREFDVDCTPFGGNSIPSGHVEKHALRIAESRLEQWEWQQEILKKRAKLASNIKKQLGR
jgi:hypothetical protein